MVSAAAEPAGSPPSTQTREFWVLMGYALVLGVVGGFAGLVFMGVIGLGTTGTSIRNPAGSAANGAGSRSPPALVSLSGCCVD